MILTRDTTRLIVPERKLVVPTRCPRCRRWRRPQARRPRFAPFWRGGVRALNAGGLQVGSSGIVIGSSGIVVTDDDAEPCCCGPAPTYDAANCVNCNVPTLTLAGAVECLPGIDDPNGTYTLNSSTTPCTGYLAGTTIKCYWRYTRALGGGAYFVAQFFVAQRADLSYFKYASVHVGDSSQVPGGLCTAGSPCFQGFVNISSTDQICSGTHTFSTDIGYCGDFYSYWAGGTVTVTF